MPSFAQAADSLLPMVGAGPYL